jgi:hypothetical protein
MSVQKAFLSCERRMEENFLRLLLKTTVLHAELVKFDVQKERYRLPVMKSERLNLLITTLRRRDAIYAETITLQ